VSCEVVTGIETLVIGGVVCGTSSLVTVSRTSILVTEADEEACHLNVTGMHVVALDITGKVIKGAEEVTAGSIEESIEVPFAAKVTVVSADVVKVIETTAIGLSSESPSGEPPSLLVSAPAKTGCKDRNMSQILPQTMIGRPLNAGTTQRQCNWIERCIERQTQQLVDGTQIQTR
jgi:hypothetical protein